MWKHLTLTYLIDERSIYQINERKHMMLSKDESKIIRERLSPTKSGIKGAACCAGISERVYHKALDGESVDHLTILLVRFGADAITEVEEKRKVWLASLQPMSEPVNVPPQTTLGHGTT